MSRSAQIHTEAPTQIPISPSLEVWQAMTPAARQDFITAATEALNQAYMMGEGRPHQRAKTRINGVLGDFFERAGRHVYLASELPVLYPGEEVFAPDLIAVANMEDPGDADTRTAWSVLTERRPIDLALEVLCHGDRNKDLVRNVAWFARLGIPEYFVYDRLRQRLYGYRLGLRPGAYVSIPAHDMRLRSNVLDLELGIIDGRIRFFLEGGAVVPETSELLSRANSLLRAVDARVEEAETARHEAETARHEAETARQDAETARQEAETALLSAETASRETAKRAADEQALRVNAEVRVALLEAELAELREKLGL